MREVELLGIGAAPALMDLPALLRRRHVKPPQGLEPAEELGRDNSGQLAIMRPCLTYRLITGLSTDEPLPQEFRIV